MRRPTRARHPIFVRPRRGTRALEEADARLADLDAGFAAGAPPLTAALQGLHEAPFGENRPTD